MKRCELELRKTFKRKVGAIEKFLEMAYKEEPLSELRQEISTQIAVNLRVLFCKSGSEPLITNARMEDYLLFPLYDRLTPFNELGDFLLVGCQCKELKCTFKSETAFRLDGKQVPTTWLSYQSWLYQIVIDIKSADYAPLSRFEIIKLLADREGAHVDPRIHPFVSLIESNNVMPFRIMIKDKECEADCCNLLCETIITIAKEVVFAYKYLNKPPIMWPRKSEPDFMMRVYDYSDEKNKRYKYTVCKDNLNLYDTNRKWPCKISSYPISSYDLLFKSATFPVDIIRIEECTLKSD